MSDKTPAPPVTAWCYKGKNGFLHFSTITVYQKETWERVTGFHEDSEMDRLTHNKMKRDSYNRGGRVVKVRIEEVVE